MSILTILLVLLAVGVCLYLINAFVPMDPKIKSILNIVVVILLVVWLLKGLGIIALLSSAKI